jgi:hypothetical protein
MMRVGLRLPCLRLWSSYKIDNVSRQHETRHPGLESLRKHTYLSDSMCMIHYRDGRLVKANLGQCAAKTECVNKGLVWWNAPPNSGRFTQKVRKDQCVVASPLWECVMRRKGSSAQKLHLVVVVCREPGALECCPGQLL